MKKHPDKVRAWYWPELGDVAEWASYSAYPKIRGYWIPDATYRELLALRQLPATRKPKRKARKAK